MVVSLDLKQFKPHEPFSLNIDLCFLEFVLLQTSRPLHVFLLSFRNLLSFALWWFSAPRLSAVSFKNPFSQSDELTRRGGVVIRG